MFLKLGFVAGALCGVSAGLQHQPQVSKLFESQSGGCMSVCQPLYRFQRIKLIKLYRVLQHP